MLRERRLPTKERVDKLFAMTEEEGEE